MDIKLRQGQVMTTFGVGSIIDIDCQSFMPADIEQWNHLQWGPEIREDSLIDRLRRRFPRLTNLYQLPVDGEKRYQQDGNIALIRFPGWLYCPHCGRLKPWQEWRNLWNNQPPNRIQMFLNHPRCRECPRSPKLLAVRFVVACPHGHIDDFPWVRWCHRNVGICNHPDLRIHSGGTAGLAGIRIECVSCHAASDMGNAFDQEALANVAICRGAMPWKGFKAPDDHDWKCDERGCNQPLKTLQRGGSNVHFPVVHSAITIPPMSEWLYNTVLNLHTSQIIIGEYNVAVRESNAIEGDLAPDPVEINIDETINRYIGPLNRECGQRGINVDEAKTVIRNHCQPHNEEEQTEDQLLYREFQAMNTDTDQANNTMADNDLLQVFQQEPANNDHTIIGSFIQNVGRVVRLREVVVMSGFTRILSMQDDRAVGNADVQEQRIAPNETTCLPACESFGEGIFIRFRPEPINEWARQPGLAGCMNQLGDQNARPRVAKVLLHTFSHCLMKELSFSAGYSLTALKEHIYCCSEICANEEMRNMYGILIYTTASDKYGTMGGLVQAGVLETLRPFIENAVKNSLYCSNDPLCREHSSGRNSWASCFACTFVPETSCCLFNRWLDRRLLVNTNGQWNGFFNAFV